MDVFSLPNLSVETLGILTGIAGALVTGIKPFVETVLPFARPNQSLHDWTLHTLNALFNLLAVAAWAATMHELSWQYALAIFVQAGYQWLSATGVYHAYTRMGGSVNQASPSPSSVSTASTPPALDPAALSAVNVATGAAS